MIKLCYKEYDFKLNLDACKYFSEKTGKDLNSCLMGYLQACQDTVGMPMLERLKFFFDVEKFPVMAVAFHAVIKQKQNNVPLSEIEDAMFRVNWLPNETDSDMCEPWALVAVDLATQVSEYYSLMDKKKADI